MDGFDFLREAFNKLTTQLDKDDLAGRLARTAGAAGKAGAERGMQEFPHSFISDAINNIYATLVSQELAEGISMSIRSYDEQKIKEVLDTVVDKLKEEQTAAAIGKQLKEVLKQLDNDQLEAAIEQLIPSDRIGERMIFKALFQQARPILDDLRTLDETELAYKIQELADTIPTDLLAMQVGALTREITPERIVNHAHSVVGKLPSGQAIADIVHGVGASAVKNFDAVAKARTVQDAAAALQNLKDEAKAIVSGQISADQVAKKQYKGKGKGGFNF